MSVAEIELFLHLAGKRPSVVHGESTETLRVLLERVDEKTEGVDYPFIFVGECDDAITVSDGVENIADSHIPADLDLTLDDLGLEKHRHIHCHCCREINTIVHFTEKELSRKFSPATTVEVATRWCRMNLCLDSAAASEFVLQLSGTTEQPRPSQHLGELVKEGECLLSFELVKEMTPQG